MAKYQGTLPALLEERTDMSPELIRTFVRNGITIMPFFRKTEVSDTDLDALVAYLTRNNKKSGCWRKLDVDRTAAHASSPWHRYLVCK